MNARGTSWHDDNLRLLQQLGAQGLAGVMVPKAETVAGLECVMHAVGSVCALLPLVESVARLDAVDALAAAPQVLRLAFGNLDFQAELGLACGPDEAELARVCVHATGGPANRSGHRGGSAQPHAGCWTLELHTHFSRGGISRSGVGATSSSA